MTPNTFTPRALEAEYVMTDPGSAGVLVPSRQFSIFRMISAGAEARTVPNPTKDGIVFSVNGVSIAGTITLTFASAYTKANDTTLGITATGQVATFLSVEQGSGTYVWRLISSDGVTGPTVSFASLSLSGTLSVTGATTLTGLTASGGIIAKSATGAAITTTRALTAADSGGIFSVAKTSAYAITLPTPAQGVRFRFMVLDTGAFAVTFSDSAAHLFGVVSVNNVSTAMTGTTLTLASAGSVGDWVEFTGIDATHYLVTGACIAAAKITIA